MRTLKVYEIVNMQFVAVTDKLKLDFGNFENTQFVELDGKRLSTKTKVLEKISEGIGIPHIRNLDSLNDILCIRGFGEELDNTNIVIHIKNPLKLFKKESDRFDKKKWLAIFLEDLQHCAKSWNVIVDDRIVGKSYLFIILQCSRSEFNEICDMLSEVLNEEIRMGYVDTDFDEE